MSRALRSWIGGLLLALSAVSSVHAAGTVVVPEDGMLFSVRRDEVVRITGRVISGGKIGAQVEGPARVVEEETIRTVKKGRPLIGMHVKEYEIRPTGAGKVTVTITTQLPQPGSKPVSTVYEFTVE